MSKLREQVSLSSNDPSGIEEIKKVLSEDKHGECYKEIYSDFNNTSSDFQDPPGNNCLLIAIAAKKDKIAELLIDDARKKLDDKEFLDFINYRYDDPTKNSVRTDCYINTSLTLAAKHEQYGLVQKLLNEGADPNGTDQYGFIALTVLTMQLGCLKIRK
ncbi:ankyrin repeat domain-containing protein [Rickettsia endosymbiont of Pantilius tunicatus]|uniref:ankyrin repeat domain-containing protein n=1 Tax=Rickettsia endosymbiont of Pantilius tunicatus TaxID=3066267 RepID=UPI0030E17A4C